MPVHSCPGPQQDDTGVRYCPLNPYRDDFDCEECERQYQAMMERFEDDRRDRQREDTRWP